MSEMLQSMLTASKHQAGEDANELRFIKYWCTCGLGLAELNHDTKKTKKKKTNHNNYLLQDARKINECGK